MLKYKGATKLVMVIVTLVATTLVTQKALISNESDSESPSFSLGFLSSQPTVLTTHWTCWNSEAPEDFSRIRFVKDADSFTGLAWFADPSGQETGQATFLVREASSKKETLDSQVDLQKEDSRKHFYGETINNLDKVSELSLTTQKNENVKIEVQKKALHSRAKQGQILVSFQKRQGTSEPYAYECRKFSETRSLPEEPGIESQVARF